MLGWSYCKKPKEKTRNKLIRLSALELTFYDNNPKEWVRDQFNAAIADIRKVRQNAQVERDKLIRVAVKLDFDKSEFPPYLQSPSTSILLAALIRFALGQTRLHILSTV